MKVRLVRALFLAVLLLLPLAAVNESGPVRLSNFDDRDRVPNNLNEATLAQLQAMMSSGRLSSTELTEYYIQRIIGLDQNGPGVNSVIELNPDALEIAEQADQMRRHGHLLGPLHGIPVLLKDNIDTGDRMQTTAGSFALAGLPAVQDSTVAAKLRAGGAVILGKTNLSEWANWRSFESTSGWSGRGGQTNNPYGIARNPCGSSSGSAAAASANFTAVSLGTETDGSIVCPGNANGVVALKPTVGLTSRAGVVPITHIQDTVGIHARTVADAAVTLGVIQSRTFDGRDPATGDVPLGWRGRFARPTNIPTDYTQFVDANGLQGATVGITRLGLAGFGPGTPPLVATPQPVLDAIEASFKALSDAGANVIDLDAMGFTGFTDNPGAGELLVLCFDFRRDVQSYFGTRIGVPMAGKTLADAIAFNNAHADVEMPYFNQDIWDACNAMAPGPDDPQPIFGGISYNQALMIDQQSGVGGIDAAISMFHLDAVVTATDSPAWPTDLLSSDRITYGTSGLAGPPGYPIIQVPAGFPKLCASTTDPTNCTDYGLPIGISFFGSAFSEPTLIKLASGYEAFTQVRAHHLPTFAQTAPFQHIKGTTLMPPHERAARAGATASSAYVATRPQGTQVSNAPKDLRNKRPNPTM